MRNLSWTLVILGTLFSSSSKSAYESTVSQASAKSCFPACSDYAGSPYCLAAGYDGDLSPKLSALKDKLAQRQAIPATWLRSTFNVASDPCNRGDSIFADGGWRNSGLRCAVKSNVEFALGDSLAVQLNVPPQLFAVSSVRGNFTILSVAGEAVTIAFEDAQWAKDWGGAIEYVAFNDRIAMFQVPRGCISVDLRPH